MSAATARARRLLWFALPLLFAAAGADTQTPRLELKAPSEMRVGEHGRCQLAVELPSNAAEPLLLTSFREGQALEIVRGRLLRSDARDPGARPLQFELPILARAPGSALVGVHLLAYVCDPRCRAVETEARANVVVLP